MDLFAIAGTAKVLPPGGFLCVADEVRSGDMVMMPELATTQAGEERFRGIGTGTVHAIAVLVVDAPHREIGMQPVPRGTFISMDRGAIADPLTGGRQRISFGPENPRQRAATSFAHRDDHFAIRRSVLREPTISSISAQTFRSDMATKICAIDFRGPPFAADLQRLRARVHRLTQFVRHDKSGLGLSRSAAVVWPERHLHNAEVLFVAIARHVPLT